METAIDSLRPVLDGTLDFLSTRTGALTLVVSLVLFTLACCNAASKAGFKVTSGLLMLVPGLNVLLFLRFAFGPWPVRRETRDLKRMQRAVHRADTQHQKRAEAA